MASHYCVYHAAKAASWNCVSCGTLVCQDCFPAAPEPTRVPYCTLCGGNMHYLGVAHALPPFWSRMPRFFAYPFALNGGVFLAVLAILTMLAVKLFGTSGVMTLLPVFIIGSLVVRQGLRVIEFCSQGRAQPPGILELFDGNPATLKMIGMMLAYGLMVGVLGSLGVLGIVAVICLSGLLPASIMLLAIHGSLRDALDPAQVLQLATRSGWSYLGLVLVLVVTAQGPQQLLNLLPEATVANLAQHSPHLLAALFVVCTAYFNMVMGAMMGYLLFQHHQDLGIRPGDEHAAAPVDRRALALARAVILVRESRYEDALRQMAGAAADFPDDLQVLEYYHKLLCEVGGDRQRVARHTERYLEALQRAQRSARLVPALDATRRVAPDYQPKNIAVRIALAEEYFRQRRFKRAIGLIGMLHREAPASDALPAAYYLLARIYSEGMRDDGKAVMILDFVLEHCPGHALTAEIANYRKVILSLDKADHAGACAVS